MIVRDLGDAWQVVLQTDHADLSGAFARAWADAAPATSLVVATERHDDGWAVWEQSPRVDDDGQAGQLPRRRRPLAPRLLPRRHRRDHGGGRRRGPARLDARRRHLPAALRPRPGARAHARGGGAGRGRRVRRRAGGEVRRRSPSDRWRTTSCSSCSTASRSTSACATSRRRGGRAPGLPARAGRPRGTSRSRRIPFGESPGSVLARPARSPEGRPRGRARPRRRRRRRSRSTQASA